MFTWSRATAGPSTPARGRSASPVPSPADYRTPKVHYDSTDDEGKDEGGGLGNLLNSLALYDVPLIEVHLASNPRSIMDQYERIEKLIQGVHQHSLPLGIIHQDIMEDLLDHIQTTAKHLGLIPSATEVAHLLSDGSFLSFGRSGLYHSHPSRAALPR